MRLRTINESIDDKPGYISPHDMKDDSFEREMWLLGVTSTAKNISVPKEREQLMQGISRHIQLQRKGQIGKKSIIDEDYLKKSYEKLENYEKTRGRSYREPGKPTAIIHDGEEHLHEIEAIAKKYKAELGNSTEGDSLVYQFANEKDRNQFIAKLKSKIKKIRVGILESTDKDSA